MIEKTETGNPTYRVYVSIYLHDKKPGCATLIFTQNAYQVAQEVLVQFQKEHSELSKINEKYQQIEINITNQNWQTVSKLIDEIIPIIVTGWKAKQSEEHDISDS